MLVNLAFCPYTFPNIPLGIASVKSYIEENSDFEVKCYDLNLLWHNDLIAGIRSGRFNIQHHDQETFLKAVELFRSPDGLFFNQALYHECASNYLNNFKQLYGVFHARCGLALSNKGPTPQLFQHYVDLLLSNNPDVVGFSGLYDSQVNFSVLAARLIRQMNKTVAIVFGGSACSSNYRNILSLFDTGTFASVSEGEETLLALLNTMAQGGAFHSVPGLAYRESNKIIVNAPSIVRNLDELPFPDFSDFDLHDYFCPKPVVPILSSRGCYWRKCTFCSHHKLYSHTYRKASTKRVVDELEYHVTNGVVHFDFVDEMIPAVRFKKIAEEIVNRGLTLYYYALAKPTSDFTKEIFEVMFQSGCRYLLWGLESGSQRILDLIDKGTHIRDIPGVLRDASMTGIGNHVFLMVGFPSETKEDIQQTLDFLHENRMYINMIHHSIFKLEKDSQVYDDPKRFSISHIYSPGPSGIKYDVAQGIGQEEAKYYARFFSENFFQHFAFFSTCLGHLRDHALLMYSYPEKLIFNMKRTTIPSPSVLAKIYDESR